ncbi:MutS protein msh4 [Coemansia sp. S100]|nr:MutS protein msh4 [Coemansia sp. S17]KAJ2102366.1 MutS protein msh4 [Coemansia sp. S100]KAJ2106256.1 MutS protein msh4 [Coemansia sp. S142-1]
MAQIGCLVPAKSATFKVFDKLFVRMSNGSDSIGGSTFLREMQGMAYILHNYSTHSLVMIDKLGCSTAAVEGMAICHAVCEELMDSSATVFLTTHYLGLPPALGVHPNCSQVVLSAAQAGETLAQHHYKATSGAQTELLYGVFLAERMGLPEDIICTGLAVAAEVGYTPNNSDRKPGCLK